MRVRGKGRGEVWPKAYSIDLVALFFLKVHTTEAQNQKYLAYISVRSTLWMTP